jgi:hypothetical protein
MLGRYEVRRRICYDETMTRALYEARCCVCLHRTQIWIEVDTGKYKTVETCERYHLTIDDGVEQNFARLLSCTVSGSYPQAKAACAKA